MTERPGLDSGASPPAAVAGRHAPGRSCRARSTRPSSTRRFLRQLERLLLLMRSPVRGGLKGGRRSVKRGQSVEFADYRDYALGDDLRQLDWNVYARLEKLFVKLFIEEEDVTVTLLLDASASMATGQPAKLAVRQAGGGRARVHRARQRGPGRGQRPGRPRSPAGGRRCAAPAGSSGCWPTCRPSSPPTGRPTSSPPPATPRRSSTVAASSSCISDLLDPAADRVIRELAATGSELIVLHVLSPDELDPPLEGDLRLVDTETGERVDITADLATIDAYKARLAAWKEGFADLAAKRRASYVDLASRRQPRRPDVRRAAPPARAGLGGPMPFTTPLALLGLLFIPAVIAMYLLKLRRDEAVVPSTLLWQRLVADVEANAPWQKLRRSLLLLLQLLLVAILALLAARPFLERPAGLARDIVLVVDTSASMGATDVVPDRLTAGQGGRRSTPCATCRPAARSASSRPTGAPGSSSTSRRTWAASAQAIEASRPPRRAATSATRSSSPPSSRRARATRRSWSRPTPPWPTPPTGRRGRAGQGPAGRSRAQEPGHRRARRPDRRRRPSRARCS